MHIYSLTYKASAIPCSSCINTPRAPLGQSGPYISKTNEPTGRVFVNDRRSSSPGPELVILTSSPISAPGVHRCPLISLLIFTRKKSCQAVLAQPLACLKILSVCKHRNANATCMGRVTILLLYI